MNERWKVLRCVPRIKHEGVSVDLNLHVLTMQAEIIPRFELMCGAIDDSIDTTYLKEILHDIARIQEREATSIKKETTMWTFLLQIDSVTFEGKFDQRSGGEVSLEQFKLAVETYLKFLSSPERNLIDVVFPD